AQSQSGPGEADSTRAGPGSGPREMARRATHQDRSGPGRALPGGEGQQGSRGTLSEIQSSGDQGHALKSRKREQVKTNHRANTHGGKRESRTSPRPVAQQTHNSASHPATPPLAGQPGSASRECEAKQGSHVHGVPDAPAGGALPDNRGAGTLSSSELEKPQSSNNPEPGARNPEPAPGSDGTYESNKPTKLHPSDPPSKRYVKHLGNNFSRDPRAGQAPRAPSFLEFLEHHARVPSSDLRRAGEFEPYTFIGREALREPCRVLDLILGSSPSPPSGERAGVR